MFIGEIPVLQTFLTSSCLTTAVFRLLLVASLWQGPILWGHQHHLASAGLSFHTAQCHSNDEDSRELGWHWHLSWPVCDESCPTDDPLQPRLPLSERAVPVEVGSLFAAFDWAGPVECPVVTEPHRGPVSICGAFLSSFCPAHTPQELLCRLTC